MTQQMITDVNEFEISEGDRVEYLGMDDFGGSLGRVDAIEADGTVYVEFDCDQGNAWACRPVNLAVVHVEPCATCLLTGAGA